MKTLPSQSDLAKYFHYDLETGKLFWKDHWNWKAKIQLVGKEAACLDDKGYKVVGFNYKLFRVQRVIWKLVYGTEPGVVDHIDGNPLNNRIQNLRSVNTRENCNNFKKHREGHLVGTTFNKVEGLWRAQITVNNKRVMIGRFRSEIEAHLAYMAEKLKVKS